jgi:hypothetical protein
LAARRLARTRTKSSGLLIRTVINNMTFDAANDPMQQAVRDARQIAAD